MDGYGGRHLAERAVVPRTGSTRGWSKLWPKSTPRVFFFWGGGGGGGGGGGEKKKKKKKKKKLKIGLPDGDPVDFLALIGQTSVRLLPLSAQLSDNYRSAQRGSEEGLASAGKSCRPG